MDKESKIAYINSQIACANITAIGMQAENLQRVALGHSMAYNDEAFFDLIKEYGIGHNTVVEYLKD